MGRLTKATAWACALAVAASAALATACAADAAAARRGLPDLAGHNVYAVLDGDGMPGDLYLTPASSASGGGSHPAARVVEAGRIGLPWTVRVGFSLDGPDVSRGQAAGASGLVGIHVRVTPRRAGDVPRAAYAQRVRVAFAIPAKVSDDVSATAGATVTATASQTTVLAELGPGERLDCYLDARGFTMGPMAVASAGSAPALADGAASLADEVGATGASFAADGAHAKLIGDLTALRDLERSLAAQEIPERTARYRQAFDAYMAAYVTSYASHLSGSIGSSTQLTALMGTAGELSGDTPVAKAVLDQASAVDAMNAARRHTGAADALDGLIRRIRWQGTDGLAQELRGRAGEERAQGAKDYAAGQSQMSQAMIPYSMAYTDVFTQQLSGLTGGSSQASSAQVAEAVAATDRQFAAGGAHAGDRAKVQAALDAMAAASERIGAGQAYRQVLLRFADEVDGGGAAEGRPGATSGASGASGAADGRQGRAAADRRVLTSGLAGVEGTGSVAGSRPLAARAEIVRLREQAWVERRAARAANAGGETTATTVVDEAEGRSDASDVMKFAGGVPGVPGGKSGGASAADRASDGAAAGTDGAAGDGAGKHATGAADTSEASGDRSGAASSDASASAEASRDAAVVEHPSPAYGLAGMGDRTLLHADMSQVIAGATTIADGGAVLRQALGDADAQVSARPAATDALRVLLVLPGL